MLNHIAAAGTVEHFTILSTIVRGHVTVQIRKLAPGAPCWFYLNLATPIAFLDEYLLMLPHLFFRTNKSGELSKAGGKLILRPRDQLRSALDLLRSNRVRHEYSVVKYDHVGNSLKIQLRDKVQVVEYRKGLICNCLPIPGRESNDKWKRSEPRSVLTPEVVVTSPNVQDTLDQLTRIWQDRFAKSVLLSAPPGSGKEAFAASIPFGNGRSASELLTLSLASENSKALEEQLFGHRRDDGSVEDGLIAKAKNSALFLDEAHQPERNTGVRAGLLRPLESDEYLPTGSNQIRRVENVLFLFATSKSLKALGAIPPIDFWTRMTHVLSIRHPLDYGERDADAPPYKEVIACFFKCFWWDRAEKFYKVDPSCASRSSDDASVWLTEEKLLAVLDEDVLESISAEFASALLGAVSHPKTVSIRGIRSIATRMFSLAASDISRGLDRKAWLANFRQHLQAVIDEILLVAKLT